MLNDENLFIRCKEYDVELVKEEDINVEEEMEVSQYLYSEDDYLDQEVVERSYALSVEAY